MAVAIAQTADPAGVSHSGNVTTYSTISIGAAAADRIVLLVVGKEVATVVLNSVTCDSGGGAVAMRLANGNTFGNMGAWIYWLGVPSGTTANFALTWSGAITNIQNHISVYRMVDGGGPPKSTGNNTSTDMDVTAPLTTGSITIPVNGGFIAVAVGATDTVAKTWANATEDLDVDAGDFRHTTALRVTSGTVTVTCTGGTNAEDGAMAWAIFEQALMLTDLVSIPPMAPATRVPR